MADEGIQHHTEVRRERRLGPFVIAVGALVLLAAVVLVRPGDDTAAEPAPAPPTTTVPTTLPARLAVVHVVADTDDGPRPATTADAPATTDGTTFEALQAPPIVTDGQVVVLVDDGTVLAGRPGDAFRRVGPGFPSSTLVASNEPGHVWVGAPGDELVLVDLDGTDPPVGIPLGGDRVLGPAAFGVVTVGDDGAISWRRPSFDPAPVGVAGGSTAVDAGGEVVLVEGAPAPGGGRRFEVWSVIDGSLVRPFGTNDASRAAVLATDGSTVALPHAAGWIIRDVVTGDQRGSLPAAPGDPAWIGEGRFAILADGVVAVSDGTELSPPWRLRALAERSP